MLFSCSTQLSWKYIMLIIVKMPTIVDIFNIYEHDIYKYESLKSRKVCIFSVF